MEQWRPVTGYEDIYDVSDLGRVRGIRRKGSRGGLLRLTPTGGASPRLHVWLQRNGDRRSRLVHHLVLEEFVGPCPPGQEARHGPGGALDNRLVNLCWGTRAENQADRVRDGTSNRGERQWQSRLTQEIVMECRRRYAAGESQTVLAAEFGVSGPGMSNVITGVTWGWLPGAVPIDPVRHGKRGTDHHAAKVTWDQVREIRRRAAAGEQQRPLAREFGISQPVVSKIVRREIWCEPSP